MVEFLVHNRSEIMVVLLRENLLVSNGLNSCMMMLLMNLSIESSSYAFMLMRFHSFLSNMRSHVLVNGSLVLSVVGKEARNGGLCFLHCD